LTERAPETVRIVTSMDTGPLPSLIESTPTADKLPQRELEWEPASSGVRPRHPVARRFHEMRAPQAKTWVSLAPGWRVLDGPNMDSIEIEYHGVRVH